MRGSEVINRKEGTGGTYTDGKKHEIYSSKRFRRRVCDRVLAHGTEGSCATLRPVSEAPVLLELDSSLVPVAKFNKDDWLLHG